MAPLLVPDPETLHLDLDDRPVCGQDLLFLQQWYKLSRNDMCYLLGLTDMKWCHYTNPSMSKNRWAIRPFHCWCGCWRTIPKRCSCRAFPPPPRCIRSTSAWPSKAPNGRAVVIAVAVVPIWAARRSAYCWAGNRQRQPLAVGDPARDDCPDRRAALVRAEDSPAKPGVAGLDEWVEQTQLEAQARGLSLHDKMTSWFRGDGEQRCQSASAGPAQAQYPQESETEKAKRLMPAIPLRRPSSSPPPFS